MLSLCRVHGMWLSVQRMKNDGIMHVKRQRTRLIFYGHRWLHFIPSHGRVVPPALALSALSTCLHCCLLQFALSSIFILFPARKWLRMACPSLRPPCVGSALCPPPADLYNSLALFDIQVNIDTVSFLLSGKEFCCCFTDHQVYLTGIP